MRGEQIFDALGSRWTLFLGNAAQCGVEQQYDRGFFDVVASGVPDVDPATAMAISVATTTGSLEGLDPEMLERAAGAIRRVRVSVLRDLAWHGLRRHHPDVTPDRVSDIIDDVGQERFGEVIGAAIRAAQGREAGGDAAPGKPGTRQSARTGTGSSKPGRRKD